MNMTHHRKYLTALLLLVTLATGLFASGCQSSSEEASRTGSEAPGEAEHGFYIQGQFYEIGQAGPIQLTDFQSKDTYSMGAITYRTYYSPGLELSVSYVTAEPEEDRLETPITIRISGEGIITKQGIQVGSSLEDLKEAYQEDLTSVNLEYIPEIDLARFNRAYTYAPEDEAGNYTAFFLQDGIVVSMEAAEDYGTQIGYSNNFTNLLGCENLIVETDNYYPEYSIIRYFAEDNGTEELLFEFHVLFEDQPEGTVFPRYMEAADLNGDDINELVVSMMNGVEWYETVIYYLHDGQIQSFEINKNTGSCNSSLLDSFSLKEEYRNCFLLEFLETDGNIREELYRFSNGVMEFVTLITDDIYLWS